MYTFQPSRAFPSSQCIKKIQNLSPASLQNFAPVTPNHHLFFGTKQKNVPTAIIGFGRLGRALTRALVSNREFHASKGGLYFAINAIIDSKGMIFSHEQDGLSDRTLIKACEWKEQGEPLRIFPDVGVDNRDMVKYVGGILGRKKVLVDVSNSEKSIDLLSQQAQVLGGIVLANKFPLSSGLHIFDQLTMPNLTPVLGMDASLLSGLPAGRMLSEIIRSGDSPKRVTGILSGFLNFIFTGLEEGRRFSDLVQIAVENRIGEPNVRSDLSGVDVARRLLILSRLLGSEIELEDLEITEIVPPEIIEIEKEKDFYKALESLNEPMKAETERVKAEGNVLRHICEVDLEEESIGMDVLEVPKDSLYGRVQGASTLLAMISDHFPEDQPLILQSGSGNTDHLAEAVQQDLIRVGQTLTHEKNVYL